MPLDKTEVNQSGAKAGQDIVAGDKNTIHHHYAPTSPLGKIEQLLEKLAAEIEHNAHARDVIDKLSRFQKQKVRDGVIGLEAKLIAGDREYEYFDALEKKELFAKLLENFSLYGSAQEILAHLLARAEYSFQQFVYPQISDLSILQVNELVDAKIIEPTISECGASVFSMDHSVAMGMIYWLAEQCYVRWHK